MSESCVGHSLRGIPIVSFFFPFSLSLSRFCSFFFFYFLHDAIFFFLSIRSTSSVVFLCAWLFCSKWWLARCIIQQFAMSVKCSRRKACVMNRSIPGAGLYTVQCYTFATFVNRQMKWWPYAWIRSTTTWFSLCLDLIVRELIHFCHKDWVDSKEEGMASFVR